MFIIGYIAKTIIRVPDWKNALSLNESAVKVNPGSARANSFMATAIYNKWRNLPTSEEKRVELIRGAVYAQNSLNMYPNYANANLMKVGISAEIYKMDNDIDKLFEAFSVANIVGGTIVIPHLRRAVEYWGLLESSND